MLNSLLKYPVIIHVVLIIYMHITFDIITLLLNILYALKLGIGKESLRSEIPYVHSRVIKLLFTNGTSKINSNFTNEQSSKIDSRGSFAQFRTRTNNSCSR